MPDGLARPAWELYVRAGLPLAGRALRTRLERGRRLPRRLDPLVLGARIRSSASSSSGALRASETSRCDGSASAAASSCGAGRRERSVGETVLVRARDRRLARLRHAPAPAVHRVASLVRRHRRLPRARRRLGTARRSGRGLRARRRDRRPRARRAARTSAADEHPELRARRAGGRLDRRRVRDRRRRARSRSSRGSSLLVPVGVFLVLAYNLELLGGRFHSDLWFGLAWGGFPVVCGYAAVAGELERRSAARGRVRRSPLARAARALEPRALRPPPRRGRRRRARAARTARASGSTPIASSRRRSAGCASSPPRPSCSRPLSSHSDSRVSA